MTTLAVAFDERLPHARWGPMFHVFCLEQPEVVVDEDRMPPISRGAVCVQVQAGGEDRVQWIVGVSAPVAVGVLTAGDPGWRAGRSRRRPRCPRTPAPAPRGFGPKRSAPRRICPCPRPSRRRGDVLGAHRGRLAVGLDLEHDVEVAVDAHIGQSNAVVGLRDALEEQVDGGGPDAPALVECDRLTVRGDVVFGKGDAVRCWTEAKTLSATASGG
jgi:hypothetical protein